jgi:ribosomal protein S20
MRKVIVSAVAIATMAVGAGTAQAASEPSAESTRRPAGVRVVRREAVRTAATAAAQAIGVTVQELRAGLRSGQSAAAQATAKGVDPAVVVDAVAAALTARIDAAVEAGTITAERAEKAKARVPEVAQRLVDRVPRRAPAA